MMNRIYLLTQLLCSPCFKEEIIACRRGRERARAQAFLPSFVSMPPVLENEDSH
jgi:hypothetical protein